MKEVYIRQKETITNEAVRVQMKALIAQFPDAKKVLLIPPDFTRCYSYAGEITKILWDELTPGVQVDIMPALGTHMEMSREEKDVFFGTDIPDHCLQFWSYRREP